MTFSIDTIFDYAGLNSIIILFLVLGFFGRNREYYSLTLKTLCAIVVIFSIVNYYYKRPSKGLWTNIEEEDIALITGGSNGLGSDIVKQLLTTKISKIIIVDIVEPKINSERIHYVSCDLSDDKVVLETFQYIVKQLNHKGQHISILINNAGIRHNKSLLTLEQDEILKLFNVNTLSPIHILKSIISNHIKNYQSKKLYIVTISSILGVLAPKNLSIYSATKASMYSIHESLVEELSEYSKIRMLLVTPGQLNTDMFKDVKPPMPFLAPLVESKQLATKIVHKINYGEIGVIASPLYANFLPAIRALPYSLQKLARYLSRMDTKVIDKSTCKDIY
ncbi:uncharacterized protein RJT21DRAFT_139983 [Scheffersomyces amazonensis]|uniref:uncharacterized protein n=1 Tax=Scheffersomyces amazonensis TaxID=1078765 RepID=UPI00315CF20E